MQEGPMRRVPLRRVLFAMVGVLMLGRATSGLATDGPLFAGGLTALPEQSGYGPNLLMNPGFETPKATDASKPEAWSTTVALSLDSTVQHSGTYSYKLTAELNTSWRNHVVQWVTVEPGTYRASGWIKTSAFGDGAGTGARLGFAGTNAPIVGGTKDWTYVQVENVVITTAGSYRFIIDQYGTPAPSGVAWYDDLKLEKQVVTPLNVFMRYPNYRGMLFEDQPLALSLDVGVTPPTGTLADHTVVLTLKDEATGAVVATQRYAAPPASFTASLDASGMWPDVPHRLEVALLGPGDSFVYAFPEFRVSRVPAARRATMNLAFDAKNRILLGDVPRFILGVYDAGGGYSTLDSHWETQIWSLDGARKLDGLRINLYLNYHLGEMPADSTAALLANLQKRNVWYLQTYNCFADNPASRINFSSANDAYVGDYGARAGSAGYYTIDECTPEMIPEAFTNLQRLKRLDPDSITFAALYPRDNVSLFREAADVLSTDPYPLYGAEPSSGYPHGNVARDAIRARDAVKDGRPFWMVLQFFKFTSDSRWPTFDEMRSHAYMSIVEGARGLLWWSVGANALQNEPEPSRTQQLDKLKRLVGELADLEAVLLADTDTTSLTGNSNSAIRTRVKVVNGTGYVFAYNNTNTTTSTTFTWSTTPGAVSVNAENRSVPVSGNSFADTFGPWEAHVYVVGASVPTQNSAPVAEGRTVSTDEGRPVTLTLTGRDAEQCELGFAVVTSPATGQVGSIANVACTPGSPNGDSATITYTPNPGFTGTDSFTYRVSDGALESAPVTVQVTVAPSANTAPMAESRTVTTEQGRPVTLSLTGRDAEQCELGFAVVTGPAGGELGAIGNGLCTPGSPNADTATITYTPAPGFTGTDAFSYRVSDGALESTAASVQIAVNPPPPSNAMYVADISFESRVRGSNRHDERVTVVVRRDSNGNGAIDAGDEPVANATVSVELHGPSGLVGTVSGATSGEGVFRTSYFERLPNGAYIAEVTRLSHSTFSWRTSIGVVTDSDGDGFPERSHGIPH
jgi:hypothetical protein